LPATELGRLAELIEPPAEEPAAFTGAASGGSGGNNLLAQLAEAMGVAISFDVINGALMMWRLGYHLAFSNAGSPERAFGHNGFGGSGAWVDPDRELSAAMTAAEGA
jgi:CubicO group peptidase (beta-lactamase class C family)